ncbi:hypothetical protein [Staphylococcus haemolyticus]|uniref:hypothetical protein n=1 Tax=Staphylococcus haemolyticus TaxID=1283 RepID=UPI00069F7210|nr:hypothetical protein [Staphylococcus haemolyticus]
MAKIKRKVEMTLPKLIEWAWENEVRNKAFYSNYSGGSVFFDEEQILFLEHETRKDETFTVEIEEEITEDTVIFRLLEVRNAIPSKKTEWQDLKLLKSYLYGNHSISEVKNEHSVAIYILNDDMTMTLVWKDGKLVD